MVGIILAAGDGNRLKNSSSEKICKPLLLINGKRLIEYALDNLLQINIDKAYIVVGKEGRFIKEAIGSNYKGLNVSYVTQKEQKGLINALMQALLVIESNEDVVLQLADEIFIKFQKETVVSHLAMSYADFFCGVTYENNPQKIKNNFSVETDDKFALISCTEKPHHINNNIKGTGFCIFRNSALNVLRNIYNENTNTPNDLCDYMSALIANKKRGFVFFVADKEFNINTYYDFEDIIGFLDL